ncbi:DMT family transporter [Neolewinella aurantiaca]|uniref:DMT family transporter n=1 Tax=Neolewinella aurantiaca TaxID=2602767 RepID=A0A5C7FK96_9BACT|nr:DMT family transporter [Neolewinella aurantiaca]TXF91749.1 DMT family transporter [Neolewinella aurantiaca]
MQHLPFYLLAIAAGLMLPIQAGLNSEMGRALKSPVYASIVSFAVGLIALLLYAFITRMPFGNLRDGLTLPWYYWIGGILGAFYVYGIIVLTPRLGVALTFGLTVAAQMLFGLMMDHYGWLDIPVSPVSWPRIVGVVMIIAGVVLIRSY